MGGPLRLSVKLLQDSMILAQDGPFLDLDYITESRNVAENHLTLLFSVCELFENGQRIFEETHENETKTKIKAGQD
jgi:hypothetical protein